MVLHKYRITWKKEGNTEFSTVFMKDFPSSIDEVQRILDVARLISELPHYPPTDSAKKKSPQTKAKFPNRRLPSTKTSLCSLSHKSASNANNLSLLDFLPYILFAL